MELVVIGVVGQAVALVALVLASRGPLQAVRIHSDGRQEPEGPDGPGTRRQRLIHRWLAAFLVATAVATAGATSVSVS